MAHSISTEDQNATITDKNDNKIYTRDEAAKIVSLFEDILSRYNITVPSPEDDEREEDDMIGLYGSTYYELLDSVEETVIDILGKNGEVIPYELSGKV